MGHEVMRAMTGTVTIEMEWSRQNFQETLSDMNCQDFKINSIVIK